MSFRHHSATEVLEPRPQQPLPSLGQVLGDHKRALNVDVFSPRGSVEFVPKPFQDQNPGAITTTQISSAKSAEVMQKTIETLRAQIHANGFTDEDIRRAREADLRKARGADVVNAYAKTLTEDVERKSLEDHSEEEYETNPYEDRADMIGLSHLIPGIGHLGDLLTPPQWNAGDEPIQPKLARQLHREAYDAAKKDLADSIADFKDLKGAAFQEASDRKNEEWQNRMDLAKLILEERVNVYQTHQERKWQQPQPVEESLEKLAPVLQLPTSSAAKVQDQPVGVAGPSRYTYGHPPPLNGFLSCHTDVVSRSADGVDQPESSPKILSPRCLDPSLIPDTIEAVLQRYHAKTAEIQKMQHENRLQLSQCLNWYGRHFGPARPRAQQAQPVPHCLGPDFQPNQQYQPAPQRLPYYHPLSDVRSEIHRESGEDHEENDQPTNYRYASPAGPNALGVYQDDGEDEPVELALSSPLKQTEDGLKTAQLPTPASHSSNGSGTPPEILTPKNRTSQKKPANSKKAREKRPVWYASHLENANLPTSDISHSAIQAGLAYNPKAPPTTKVTEANLLNSTKKRRRHGDDVPIPEFKMPPEKIRAMFASSLPMKYIGKGSNPYLVEEDGAAMEGAQGGGPLAKRATKGKAKRTGKAPEPKTHKVGSDLHIVSDLSDGIVDDEKDATYGGKAKNGTPKKGESAPSRRATPRKAKMTRMTKAGTATEAQISSEQDGQEA